MNFEEFERRDRRNYLRHAIKAAEYARDLRGHPAAAPPRSLMNSRRLIRSPRRRE